MHKFTHNRISIYFIFLLGISLSFGLTGCDDDEGFTPSPVEKPSKTYRFKTLNDSQLAGYVKFSKNEDNSTEALIFVAGTEAGNTHPAHIHANSAVEGGDIAITFEPVDGATGRSVTTITQTDAGAAITYDELLNYDGYVNVHLSANDLTVVVQTDIGGNELTGTTKTYALGQKDGSGNTGSVLFQQRKNNNTLATITLDSAQKLTDGANYAAHIHNNTAAETGGIAVSFSDVSGTTGTSLTHIEVADDGTPITYEAIVGTDDAPGYDGYVNVHQAGNLAVLIVQGDIGANELTGDSETYTLVERDAPGITGEATFEKRANGETLVTLALEGTPEGGEHPAHIHANTAAEGGAIVVTFNPVNGTTGMSMTNVATTDDGVTVTYDSLLNYDGYINVHLSAADLGTIVAQGDIGQNALTGEKVTYELDSVAVATIKGSATFYERKNGTSLVEILLEGTPADGTHPAHIHANTAAESGPIAISLASVNGATGASRTQVSTFDDGTAVTYAELIDYDGYINVHLSATDLGTIVAQGDVGSNALTGETVTYPLAAVAGSGVSGNATFAERKDGTALVTLQVTGTPTDGDHPAHIHYNSAAEGGAIAISLTNVNGATGVSKTSVMALDNNRLITYEELTNFDGYINIHLSPTDLATIVAQGNIGANVVEEE
ncbi:MAG: CHRD domain-containing protein [Tunicatimonas sp.]